MKLLLYCCKAKPYLKSHSEYEYNEKGAIPETRKRIFTLCQDKCDYYNGKIVAECDYEVEEIKVLDCNFRTFTLFEKEILNKSCLTYHELFEYLKNRDNPRGYAIHIKNLHIFDKPKELSEYDKYEYEVFSSNGGCIGTEWKPIDKAPQNMMYVYDNGEKKIIISINPEWLCKILKGEKTIEVRKKVLKEMVKND